MHTNYPKNLEDYYKNKPSLFEKRADITKRTINYVLTAICVLLLSFPAIIPIGDTLVRIISGIALLYFGYSAFFGSKYWYNISGNGKIKESAIKAFRYPFYHNVGGYTQDARESDVARIKQMLEENDFAGLADEPADKSGPLKLTIHEDAAGKTFYMQLSYDCKIPALDFKTSDVKMITEPQYSEIYRIIKSIRSLD